jgi:hypothetical protein
VVVEAQRALSLPGDRAGVAVWLEAAVRRRATVGDRTTAWHLACAVATARASALIDPRQEAERTLARAFGDLRTCSAASAHLPENIAWIVAGAAAPSADATTIELARRNAAAHLERLDAELADRGAKMIARARAGELVAVSNALGTYEAAAVDVRAALQRALDYVLAHADAPALAHAAASSLSVVDAAVVPALRRRIDSIKAQIAG